MVESAFIIEMPSVGKKMDMIWTIRRKIGCSGT